MRSRPVTRWFLAILAGSLWGISLPVEAGFKTGRADIVRIGPGDASAKLDKTNVSAPVPAADIARMKANYLYASLSDAQIQGKVEKMRRALICAIELIKGENLKVGEGLEKLYKTNGICIGLAPKGYRVTAEIRPDGKEGFDNRERINVYPCLSSANALTDYDVFRIYDTLSHEGLHAVQKVDFSPSPNLTQALDIMCREVEAHEGNVARLQALLAVLESLRDTGTVPADAKGGAKAFGDALKAGANAAVIADWIKQVKRDLGTNQNLVKFRTTYKKAAELAVAGDPDVDTVLKSLKHWGSWYRFFGKQREFGPITDYYLHPPAKVNDRIGMLPPSVTGQAQFTVSNPTTEAETTVSLPADTLSDGLLINQRLYVAGVDGLGGPQQEGVVFAYDLTPSGDVIQPGIECVRDPALAGGACLFEETSTGNPWCMNRETGGVFLLEDTNSDTYPDSSVYRGFCAPPEGLFGCVDAMFVDDNTIACTGFPEETCQPCGFPTTYTQRPSSGADFLPWGTEYACTDDTVAPSCSSTPRVGSVCLAVSGTPGVPYTMTLTPPGGGPTPLATGVFSPATGRDIADLNIPLPSAPNTVTVIDQFGRTSAAYPVLPPLPHPALTFDRGTDDSLQFRCDWRPGYPVTCASSPGLASDSFVNVVSSGPAELDGSTYISIPFADSTLLYPSQFYLCQSTTQPPIPVATPDAIDCVMGVPVRGNVADNDIGCPPGTKFEIVTSTSPQLHEDSFRFFPTGEFEVRLPAFFSPVTFEYRPVLDGYPGQAKQVVLQEASGILTDPRTFTGHDGSLWREVYCLLYSSESFPLYQFYMTNNPADTGCLDPHWHWRFGIPVFSVQQPTVPVVDPATGACGFGKTKLTPVTFEYMSDLDWQLFIGNHP